VLDELGGVDVGDEDRRLEGLVDALHQVCSAIAGTADDDAIGVHQVRYGAAFAKEFGVGDDVEFGSLIVALDGVGDLFTGLDRDGRFIDDHAVLARLENAGDLAGDALDVGQVDRSVTLRGSRNGDKHNLAVIDAVFDQVREAKALCRDISVHQFFEPRLVNGDLTALEHVHFALVVVDADDVVADFGEAGAGDESDVSRTDNAEIHNGLLNA
jgi:hypothetical protein